MRGFTLSLCTIIVGALLVPSLGLAGSSDLMDARLGLELPGIRSVGTGPPGVS